MARKDTATLKADAKKNLEARWKVVQAANLANDPFPAHKQVVSDLLRSGTKAYRYLAVSQVLAKLTDPEVDPRCLQAQCKHASGAFDARSFASSVVVPWEQANGGALGQSADPFVSNPFRVPDIDASRRNSYRDKDGYDKVVALVDTIHALSPADAEKLLDQVLTEYRRLLQEQQVNYPAPIRASLGDTLKGLQDFLSQNSGGTRLQACVWAAIRTANARMKEFDDVVCGAVNASDKGKRAADVDCRVGGIPVKGYEAKEMTLSEALMNDKIRACRDLKVKELTFVVHANPLAPQEVLEKADREYRSGLNVYIIGVKDFFEPRLRELGEDGRAAFIAEVGKCLDDMKADYVHRKAWEKAAEGI